MTDLVWVLRAIEGIVLVIGAAIAILSFRAYRRTRAPNLAFLGAGFGLVTVAAVAAGILYELTTHDLLTAWIVSTGFDAIGFLLILYSILGPSAPREEEPFLAPPPEDAP